VTARQSHFRVAELTMAVLALCSAALLLCSIYRAATTPFTIDESLSFAIFTWDPEWGAKANNHWLNTTLMRWCSGLLGDSEISLRLPNVLAHAVFLLSTLGIVRLVRPPELRVVGFMLFAANLFVLDFFSLARGYGLAIAAETVSLYLFVQGCSRWARPEVGLYVGLSAAAGAVAVLANYSFLNYYLPLVAVGAWVLLSDASLHRPTRRHVPRTLGFLAANAAVLAIVVPRIFRLRRAGQLYVGGSRGFIVDTLASLVRASLYERHSSALTGQLVCIAVVGVFLALMIEGATQWWGGRQDTRFTTLAAVLGAAVALPVGQHLVLRTVYPIERAALFYVPLFAATLLFALASWLGDLGRGWKRSALIGLTVVTTVALGWHFARHYKLGSSFTWWHDAHNTEVLRVVSRDHDRAFPGQPVTLRVSSILIPSFNFYRITRHYTWLVPLEREPITRADAQYIYAFEEDLDTVRIDLDTKLASFPDIGTVLVRVAPRER